MKDKNLVKSKNIGSWTIQLKFFKQANDNYIQLINESEKISISRSFINKSIANKVFESIKTPEELELKIKKYQFEYTFEPKKFID